MRPNVGTAIVALFIALCAPGTASSQTRELDASMQPPEIWGDLRPGAFGVAFGVHDIVDWTRTMPPRRAGRPLRIATWRPVTRVAGAPLTIGAMARLLVTPPGTDTTDLRRLGVGTDADWSRLGLAVPVEPGVPEDRLHSVLALPLFARHDATASTGTHPLVVIGQGYQFESPLHQAVLAEYLASHGFVVVTTWLQGATMPVADLTSHDLEAAAADVAAALAWARRQQDGEPAWSAAIGFDFGAMAALVATARDPGIRAYVSVDGGIREPGLIARLLRRVPDLDLAGLDAPMLIVARPPAELAERGIGDDGSIVVDAVHAERTVVHVRRMRHIDFTTFGALEGPLPGLWGPAPGEPAHGFAAVARTVRAFLAAMPGIEAAGQGVAAELRGTWNERASVAERLPATPRPVADGEVMRAALGAEGVTMLRSLLRDAVRARRPVFVRDPDFVARAGYELLYRHGRPLTADSLFAELTKLAPSAAAFHEGRGDVARALGSPARAVPHYRRALALDPDRRSARSKLTAALQAPS